MQARPIYLIVTPFFPSPDDWRGAYVEDFARAMMRLGEWDVRVMKLDYSGRGVDYDLDGIRVMALPFKRLKGMCFPMLFARRNLSSFAQVLKRHGIDKNAIGVLHAHTALCTIYARGLDCASLEHHHDCESFGLHLGWPRWSRLYRLIEKRVLMPWHRRMTAHVFISERVRRNFETAMGGPVDGYVLYNGVDRRKFFPRREAPGNRDFVIGCVGNFEKGKDQESLIEAARGMAGVELRFIGTGPLRRRCEALAARLGVKCRWDCERWHGEMREWYQGLDLFVLPSSYEGMGCVFLEAAACGVPFACSDAAGVSELITADRERWVFKAGDSDDLRAKIERFRRDGGSMRLAEYDIDALVARFGAWAKGLAKR